MLNTKEIGEQIARWRDEKMEEGEQKV